MTAAPRLSDDPRDKTEQGILVWVSANRLPGSFFCAPQECIAAIEWQANFARNPNSIPTGDMIAAVTPRRPATLRTVEALNELVPENRTGG